MCRIGISVGLAVLSLPFVAITMPLAIAAGVQLAPVDEAVRHPDFFSFRARLIETVVQRDHEKLLTSISPQIRNSFGGDDGIEGFRKKWSPERSDSELWREMGAVLALGGMFDDAGNFVAPYTFAGWPESVDAFTHVAVIGARVNIRAAPAIDAQIIATASFEILECLPSSRETDEWMQVRLSSGASGFIARAYARSPVDYRAMFRKTDGRWQMVFFVAGD